MKVKRAAAEVVGWSPPAEALTAMTMTRTKVMMITVRPRHPIPVKEAEECLNSMKTIK